MSCIRNMSQAYPLLPYFLYQTCIGTNTASYTPPLVCPPFPNHPPHLHPANFFSCAIFLATSALFLTTSAVAALRPSLTSN